MTENEIIKALECCKPKQNRNCGDCPAYDLGNFCAAELRENALDLINRQKAEIERLQRIEIEIDDFCRRLCRVRMLNGQTIASYADLQNYIQKEKSEAVKEFAERLKEKDGYYNHIFDDCVNTEFCSHDYVEGRQQKSREIRKTIDNLVKEMVGENNG